MYAGCGEFQRVARHVKESRPGSAARITVELEGGGGERGCRVGCAQWGYAATRKAAGWRGVVRISHTQQHNTTTSEPKSDRTGQWARCGGDVCQPSGVEEEAVELAGAVREVG